MRTGSGFNSWLRKLSAEIECDGVRIVLCRLHSREWATEGFIKLWMPR